MPACVRKSISIIIYIVADFVNEQLPLKLFIDLFRDHFRCPASWWRRKSCISSDLCVNIFCNPDGIWHVVHRSVAAMKAASFDNILD